MIGHFLEKFDDKLFRDWKAQATDLVGLLQEGLTNLDFGSNTPIEIINIKAAILELEQNKSLDNQAYYKQVEIIKTELEKLAVSKDFNNTQVNNFIFQANRSFNSLQGALYSVYNKYADAILNPSGKEQEQEDPAFIKGKLLAKVARIFTDSLVTNIKQDAVPFLRAQIDIIKKSPPIKITNIVESTTEPSLLEQRIGKEKYKKLQVDLPVNNAKEASKYISEEIYSNSFEAMYMHVATWMDTLHKINVLSQKGASIVEIMKERENLLKEHGFTELDSLDAKKYLNNLSQHLGFTDADVLYDNFQNLHQLKGHDKFKENKKIFVSFAHEEILAKNDPLEKIKAEVTREYHRLQNNIEQDGLSPEKANYANLIGHAATNIIPAIVKIQRTRNIGEIVGEDFSGVNKFLGVGIVGFAMNWLNVKKYAIDGYVLNNLSKEVMLAQKRMTDVLKSVNAAWVEKIAQEVHEQQSRRDKLIGKEQWKQFSDEELTQNYIASMREYKQTLKEFSQVTHKDKSSSEYLLKHTTFLNISEKHKNFRDAFKLKANHDIRSLSSENLEHYIASKAEKIENLSKQMKIKVEQLNTLKDEEKKQKSSVLGRVASFFGFKPKSVKQRENEIQRLYDEIEPLGLELEIQRDLIARAESQSTLINEYDHSSPLKLSSTIISLDSKYLLAYQQMVSDYKAASNGQNIVSILFKHQSKFASIENKLMLASQKLIEKLKSEAIKGDFKKSPPEEMAKLQRDLIQLRENILKFDRSIIGLGDGIQHPLLAQIAELETEIGHIVHENTALSQERLFKQAKEKVTALFASKPLNEIQDPFQFVQQEQTINFGSMGLAHKAALLKHTANAYIDLLNKSLPLKSKEEIEKLYFELETIRSQPVPPDLKGYYDSFANTISPKLESGLPKDLSEWDNEFLRLTRMVQSVSHKSMLTWLKVFVVGPAVSETKAYAEAVIAYYQKFATQYLSVTPQFNQSLDHEELGAHIHRLSEISNMLQTMLKSDPTNEKLRFIANNCQQRLETAQKLDQGNVALVLSLDNAIAEVDSNLQKLVALEKEIGQFITSNLSMPSLEEYQTTVRQVSTNRDIIVQQMKQMDSRFEHLTPTDRTKNKDFIQWQEDKKKVMSKLNSLDNSINELNKNKLPIMQFYQDISQKKNPTISLPTLTADDVGKGLLLAISNGNDCVSNLLSAAKIDSSYLKAALKKAASHGDLANVQKLVDYRKDINLDIMDSIKQANAAIPLDNPSLDEPHRKVLNYLMMNSSFIPSINDANDRSLIEDILVKLNSDDSKLSPVQYNLIDSDGPKLDQIRSYFILQEILITSLNDEYRSILSKTSSITDKDNAEYLQLKDKINQFYGKLNRIDDIGRALEKFHPYTDNKERKDKYISTWKLELKKMTSDLDNEVQRILTPPPIAAQEQLNAAIQVTPKVTAQEQPHFTAQEAPPIPLKESKKKERPKSMTVQQPQSEKVPDLDFQFKDAKQKLQEMLSRDWPSTSRVQAIINQLKSSLTPGNKDEYNSLLSTALNQLAKKDRPDAFSVVLSFVEDEQLKHEFIRNALDKAIDAKQMSFIKYIFENRIFQIKNPQIDNQFFMDKISAKNDPKFTLLILSYVPLPLNEEIRSFIQESDLAENTSISEIEPDKSLWLQWNDKDKPHLEEIRKAYQFCEKAMIDIEDDIFWRFVNNGSEFQTAMQSSHLSLEDVQHLENQIAERKKAFQEQVKILKGLKQQVVEKIKNANPPIINKVDRINEHLEVWDRELVLVISKATQSMTKELNQLKPELEDIKKGIQERQKLAEQRTSSEPQKRQNHLSFSKDKNEDAKETPTSEATSEPTPPSRTRKNT